MIPEVSLKKQTHNHPPN